MLRALELCLGPGERRLDVGDPVVMRAMLAEVRAVPARRFVEPVLQRAGGAAQRLVALPGIGTGLAVPAATRVGPVAATDSAERELRLAELRGGGEVRGQGPLGAGDARMLEATQPEVLQLGLEVGFAVLPSCGTFDRLVLAERAVEEQLGGFCGAGAQQVQHHRVRRRELGVDGELTGDRCVVDVAKIDVTLLEDHPVPDGVDAAPAGAPHELGQLAAGE